MERDLHEWLSCPDCESADISLFAYDTTLRLQCSDCQRVAKFELGEPPLHEFGATSQPGD